MSSELAEMTDAAATAPHQPPPSYSTATDDGHHSHHLPQGDPRGRPFILGIPSLDLAQYNLADSTITTDQVTQTTTLPILSTDPDALVHFIQQQAALPPKPVIRITGTHLRHNETVSPDFDLFLNITPYIVRDEATGADTWQQMKLTSHQLSNPLILGDHKIQGGGSTMGLEGWAQIFCEDPTPVKSFSLERKVINWDTAFLEGQIIAMIRKTNFVGQVAVTFPVSYAQVVVKSSSPVPSGKSAQSTLKNIFSSSSSSSAALPPKDYHFVTVEWPYATIPPTQEKEGQRTRRCAVEPEREWWEKWRVAIANCVIARRSGWVTMEDRVEAAMGLDRVAVRSNEPWGVVSSI